MTRIEIVENVRKRMREDNKYMQGLIDEKIPIDKIKKEPLDIDLMMLLAQIKIEQGDFDDALEYCKMVTYVDSRYAPAICKRADVYVLKNDVEMAKEYYQKAIKIDPKYALSFNEFTLHEPNVKKMLDLGIIKII
jgi:tetratricopeptide (TPR) repeat protein